MSRAALTIIADGGGGGGGFRALVSGVDGANRKDEARVKGEGWKGSRDRSHMVLSGDVYVCVPRAVVKQGERCCEPANHADDTRNG